MKMPLKFSDINMNRSMKVYHEDGKFKNEDQHQYNQKHIEACLHCSRERCTGGDRCREMRGNDHE